ncbi:MAG: GNAT family N-acetyltransferase [Candidatus Limnocylindrales bacterium]
MSSPTSAIATARLDLVPLRLADADEMVDVLADPALYTFIGGEPPTRAELADRYVAQVRGASADGREAWHNWIVRERATGAAAGFVQATVIVGNDTDPGSPTPSAEIAWVIGTPWQRRGYAIEAARGVVDWLDGTGIRTIVVHVHPDHVASARVAARAGLEPTDAFVDGERAWRRTLNVRPPWTTPGD